VHNFIKTPITKPISVHEENGNFTRPADSDRRKKITARCFWGQRRMIPLKQTIRRCGPRVGWTEGCESFATDPDDDNHRPARSGRRWMLNWCGQPRKLTAKVGNPLPPKTDPKATFDLNAAGHDLMRDGIRRCRERAAGTARLRRDPCAAPNCASGFLGDLCPREQ